MNFKHLGTMSGEDFVAVSGQGARSKRKKKCLLDNYIYLTKNDLGYKNKSSKFFKSNLPGELYSGALLLKLRPKE